MARETINRPDCEKAFSFEAGTCDDPGCGLHIIAERRDGTAICEIIIGRKSIHGLLQIIHDEGLDL
ncbi:hypothetical protein KIP88_02385 [Bradyrhizobium sp. SRL28]|uniref:hypothetical protein n=1 Tax=Bradyrhizobium sp. SRL28 TaxID=2836178 RepID=UPI001BDDF277|nr:hypothetical protein [Bradyrhizobium sp. SRL28]MBT1509337.1 hypothetical protein [Bradyrhizobium sp. SRL28]